MFGYDNLTAQQLAELISSADKSLRAIFIELLKPYHLGISEWLLLGIICAAPERGIGLSAAARKLDVSPSQITLFGNRLAERKLILIKAQTKDQRRNNLVARSRGRTVMEESEERIRAHFHKLLLKIANNQLRGFVDTTALFAGKTKTPRNQENNLL